MRANYLVETMEEAEWRASQGQKIVAIFSRMDQAETATRNLFRERGGNGHFKCGYGIRYDNGGCFIYFALTSGREVLSGLEINGYIIDKHCLEFNPQLAFEFEVYLKQRIR